jgi:1-acyl-sn-glycerol-3-phosphate acyltransferase
VHVQSRQWTRSLWVLAAVVRPLLMVLTKRDWRGTERFPDGGFVLVVNHLSHADPLLVAHLVHDCGIPPRFLAKASVFGWPVLGPLFRATGQIPVHRGSLEASQAYSSAVEAVQRGDCVIVYPEGTLTRDRDLWPMTGGRTGAVRVALATGCPVVPVAQWGAHQILYPYARRLRLFPRRTITMAVGDPVALDDLRGRPLTVEVLQEGTERAVTAITGLLEVVRHEVAPPQRFDLRRDRFEQHTDQQGAGA